MYFNPYAILQNTISTFLHCVPSVRTRTFSPTSRQPIEGLHSVRSNICCPRDCVSRHNGGTLGAPLKPPRVDSVERCKCWTHVGINGLNKLFNREWHMSPLGACTNLLIELIELNYNWIYLIELNKLKLNTEML